MHTSLPVSVSLAMVCPFAFNLHQILTCLAQLLCNDQLGHIDLVLQQICNNLLSVPITKINKHRLDSVLTS